ncbi:MAG: tetratricopeptide repeat protein [Planctomycetaceae bacterium]
MADEQRAAGMGDPFALDLAEVQERTQVDFEIDFFERILSRDPEYVDVLRSLADLFAQKGLHRRALHADLKLAELLPRCADVFYNIACSQSVLGEEQGALLALERALELGFSDQEKLLHDPDLSRLRPLPQFVTLISRYARGQGPLVVG